MRTRTNLLVQCAAIVVFLLLRQWFFGWMALAYLVLGGPLFTLIPLVLSIVAARWYGLAGRMERLPTLAFAGAAVSMVLVGALFADHKEFSEEPDNVHIPLLYLLGTPDIDSTSPWMTLGVVGWLAFAGYFVALGTAIFWVIRTAVRGRAWAPANPFPSGRAR